MANLENKFNNLTQDNNSVNRILHQKEKKIKELDSNYETSQKELSSTAWKLKDITLKHNIGEMKIQKLLEDIQNISKKNEKLSDITKAQENEIEELSLKLSETSKNSQKFERELNCIK